MPDPRVVHGETMTDLLHKTTRRALNCSTPDAVLNIESHFYDVILTSDSCALTLDVGHELWLNRSRWSRLTKEYIPHDSLWRFVDQAQEILRGDARLGATANMLFNDPVRYEKKHRWGGCLMGATFRGNQVHRPTITFYSRTSYMGYIGMLDAAIAYCMAWYMVDGINDLSVDDIHFRWHLSSMQLHCFKTLPFIYSQPDLMQKLERYAKVLRDGRDGIDISPTWRNIAKWYNKVLLAYEEHGTDMLAVEKYGPFKRIKRRWLEHMGHLDKNIPPSLDVSELDFEKCM